MKTIFSKLYIHLFFVFFLALKKSTFSVSEMVGPTFEGEARDLLRDNIRMVCPWGTDFSRMMSRQLDNEGPLRQADVFCYVQGDALGQCINDAELGIRVLSFSNPLPPLQAVQIEGTRPFSPADSFRKGPHKYFLAEAYSGANESKIKDKVVQLETLIDFTKKRWEDRGYPAVEDITQIIGAAALIFSCGSEPRKVFLENVLNIIRINAGPKIQRLAQAGRMLVVVLDKGHSPLTYNQRAVANHLTTLQEVQEEMHQMLTHLCAPK